MVDKKIAIKWYEKGKTLNEIGKYFGVSRQRINQIILLSGAKRKIIHNPYQTKKPTKHKKPNASEIWVSKKLKTLGYKVSFTAYGNKFDLLVNDSKKIEVKYANSTHLRGTKYYFSINVYSKNYDFLIAVVGNLSNNPTSYIFPVSYKTHGFNFPANPVNKSKYEKEFKEAWNLI